MDINILGGEPVFRGTRVSIAHVGLQMLRGASTDEMLEDYPGLTMQDFFFAVQYLQEQR